MTAGQGQPEVAVPKKILVTGPYGQLGTHARIRLKHVHGIEAVPADRTMMADPGALADAVSMSDGILHIAGVNRAPDEDLMSGNSLLADALVSASKRCNHTPPLAYANSIHAQKDTVYGRAKRNAASILSQHWTDQQAAFADFLLPNLFGEFSKPHYNNFTGTFCHQIAAGIEPQISSDAPINLLHYGDAAEAMIAAVLAKQTLSRVVEGVATSVGTVAHKLKTFDAEYSKAVFPALETHFDVQLFNALRQVRFGLTMPGKLLRHADSRGSFYECVRAHPGGQTSFSTTLPGITRGNHFHFSKIERFVVLSGQARISVRSLADDRTWHFDVSGQEPVYVDMPPLHTHNISNTGTDELLTLFWVNGFFDPSNPDTYLEAV